MVADSRAQQTVIKPPALLESGGSLHVQDSNSGEVEVKPFKCIRSTAMQSTTDEAGVTKLQRLKVKSGKYKDILTIPGNWTDPPFRSINACAISPKDEIIYCSMEINGKGSFLVRIDMRQVAFVAKLPGWRYAAAFDEDGKYWMYGETGLSVIKDVASKPSYSSWSYLSGNAPDVVSMTLGADLAVVQGDLDKTGGEGTYLLSLYKSTLYVVKVSGGLYRYWALAKTSGLPPSAVTWGTAWNYKSSIFFSADTGEGVYRLDDGSLNIENGSASFIYMGPAQETDWNDGFSCLGKGTPWEPDMLPDSCDGGKALQATTTNLTVPTTPASKTYLQYLDIKTGTYQLYYEVDKNWTDPPFNSINSCAINPLDNIVYCTMEIDGRGSFLVRIDSAKVGYVAKVPGWMYAGVFDAGGNYYLFGNSGLSFITKVTGMPAYTSYNHLGGGQVYNGPHKVEGMGADMAVFNANLEGKGKKTYLLSVENSMLSVVRPDSSPPESWKLVGEGLPSMTQTWGSAWNFRKRIYFAPDSGAGVYELDTKSINLQKGTAKFRKAGKSQTTTWNDGFSCIQDISPFETTE